jgi:hypothetical protein
LAVKLNIQTKDFRGFS